MSFNHGSRLLVAAALPFCVIVLLLAAVTAITATGRGATACPGQPAGPPSSEAQRTIPDELMPFFEAAERAYGVPWNVLAAVNTVETDFGRNLGPSSAGAVGWMQFMPATWARYGVDADGDGRADPNNPADAIFSAAAYLRASGASDDLRRALFAYNHAGWYVELVLDWARRYAAPPTATGAGAGSALCAADSGELDGVVEIAPGTNLPDRPLAPETLAFLARMAALYGGPLVVTTATNHSHHTLDGRMSDHGDGHAVDLGITANGDADDSPVGDRIMAACLIAAGTPADRAIVIAHAGGLYTLEHDGTARAMHLKDERGRQPPQPRPRRRPPDHIAVNPPEEVLQIVGCLRRRCSAPTRCRLSRTGAARETDESRPVRRAQRAQPPSVSARPPGASPPRPGCSPKTLGSNLRATAVADA